MEGIAKGIMQIGIMDQKILSKEHGIEALQT